VGGGKKTRKKLTMTEKGKKYKTRMESTKHNYEGNPEGEK
jgi:hypothetical protein